MWTVKTIMHTLYLGTILIVHWKNDHNKIILGNTSDIPGFSVAFESGLESTKLLNIQITKPY